MEMLSYCPLHYPHLDEGVIKMIKTEEPGRHSQLVEDTRDQETHSGGAQHLLTQ